MSIEDKSSFTKKMVARQ